MATFEFCSSTVLYGEQTLDRACAELAGVGLAAVDLWHVKGWCEHLAGGTQAVRQTLARYGLRLEALTAFHAEDAELSELLPVLSDLGGHALIIGSTPPEVPVAAFAERIAPLVRRASRLGVRLAIENHRHATIDSLASMVELAETLPEPGLGFALAPIHLWIRQEDTAEAVRRLRDRIAFMYIWDWGPTAQVDWKDPREQLIGTGKMTFAPIFAALREVGYARPLGVFAHGPEHWPPEQTTAALAAALERARAIAGPI